MLVMPSDTFHLLTYSAHLKYFLDIRQGETGDVGG